MVGIRGDGASNLAVADVAVAIEHPKGRPTGEKLNDARIDAVLEARSVLRIVRNVGQALGLHLTNHMFRHSSITVALDVAARAGIGLDKVRAHSRHAAIGTLLIYADEHDRIGTQRTLADLVACTLTT